MRIKRFDNLWTMGLLLFGAILAFFYVAKIFFPQFIIGIAEIPSVVAFGNYVDTHLWANTIFQICISYFSGYIYFCACCRRKALTIKQHAILFGGIIVGLLVQRFCVELYTPFNYVVFVLNAFLMLAVEKDLSKETFISTVCCFSADILTQAISMYIRDIIVMATLVNSATVTILLIDVWIWRALFYMFFNYKKDKEN